MTQGFNPFAGMRTAQTSFQGQYFSPGRYRVRIDKCVYRSTQNSGDVFLIETTVLETNNDKDHPVGAQRTWMQGTKNKNVYMAAVKMFCIAACGLDIKSEADAEKVKVCEERCEEIMLGAITRGALNGREVWIDVVPKEKKNTPGETFNLHVFSPVKKAA